MQFLNTLNRAMYLFSESVTITTGGDPTTMFSRVLGILITVLRYVGGGLAIWGIYSFAISITQDGQQQQRAQGIACIISGVILIFAKVILQQIGLIG